jgi:hypothetical protein
MIMTIGLGLLCLRFITDIKDHYVQLRNSSRHRILWLIVSILPLLAFSIFLSLISPGQVEPITIGWLMLAAMVVVLFMGLPIAFGLLFIGIVGYWVLAGPARTLSVLGIIPYDKVANYTLSVIPLFILIGLAYQKAFIKPILNRPPRQLFFSSIVVTFASSAAVVGLPCRP